MLGMKFRNNREGGKDYGRVATVVRYDETAKSAVLQFDDGNGAVPISTSTLKRWWKKVDIDSEVKPLIDLDNSITDREAEKLGMITGDEAVEQAVVDPDDVAGDGTPYTKVMQEILADEEKHVQEVMQQKQDLGIKVVPIKEVTIVKQGGKKVNKKIVIDEHNTIKSNIISILEENGLGYLTYEKFPGVVVVKQGKKSVFELRITKKGITFNCRIADVPAGLSYTTVKNYYMPAVIKTFDNYMEVFNTLLNLTKEEK